VATNYPGSLDSFDTIASDKKTSDSVGGRTHRQMHNDVADALEAVQAELGTDPAGTFATVKARLAAYDAYAAKTSAYTATVDDGTLNVTSGTFTLDLPAASTFTGRSLQVKNSGTGVVTLDGNSSETIEGVATFPLGPGSYVQITSIGSAWILTGGAPDTGWRSITLTGSWTGTLRLRRIGSTVNVVGNLIMPASGATIATLAAEFRPVTNLPTFARNIWTGNAFVAYISSSSGDVVTSTTLDSTRGLDLNAAYTTTAAWPTSLPGTAA
jgi:hypothetical protein